MPAAASCPPAPRRLRRAAFAALTALMLAGAIPVGAPPAGAADFLADVEDLPLPEGLVEDPEARVAFDKPGGRVVEAAASGELDAEAVTGFYRETLPALGWRPDGSGEWRREGEILRVSIVEPGPPVRVQFTIAPDGR